MIDYDLDETYEELTVSKEYYDKLKDEKEELGMKLEEVYETLEEEKEDNAKKDKHLKKLVEFIKNNDCDGAYQYAFLKKLI